MPYIHTYIHMLKVIMLGSGVKIPMGPSPDVRMVTQTGRDAAQKKPPSSLSLRISTTAHWLPAPLLMGGSLQDMVLMHPSHLWRVPFVLSLLSLFSLNTPVRRDMWVQLTYIWELFMCMAGKTRGFFTGFLGVDNFREVFPDGFSKYHCCTHTRDNAYYLEWPPTSNVVFCVLCFVKQLTKASTGSTSCQMATWLAILHLTVSHSLLAHGIGCSFPLVNCSIYTHISLYIPLPMFMTYFIWYTCVCICVMFMWIRPL